MKTLFFASLLVLGSLTTIQAQTELTEIPDAEVEVVQDYAEVKISELPQPVKDAVARDFEAATISKAYKNEKGEFKLLIATAEKQSLTLFADKNGEWLKKK
jgi:hypothetical protein